LGWFLTVLLMAAGVALAYWFGIQFAQARWAIRWALLTLLGGLAAYNYLVLELPGSSLWLDEGGLSVFLQAILFGQSIGFLAGWVWRLMAERRKQTQE
jgi:E3 ubiquitin-protein ligase DOA10